MAERREGNDEGQLFVQYAALGLDPAWRRLPDDERTQGREALLAAAEREDLTTYGYALTGLRADADLLLWRLAPSLEALQAGMAALLRAGMGRYLVPQTVMTGLVRGSTYVRRPTSQEQGMLQPNRMRYLIVYPFVKTVDWYLLSREARQGMMNEHIRVGRGYPAVRQLLAYSFGLDDQEFIVAYETDDLVAFQDLVRELRETEARRYTLRDTPIFTGIHRPLAEAAALSG